MTDEVETIPVVIVGGGQAGLSMSWHLTQAGIEHVVLERDTVMHSWRDARWDSFCLVTPNWQCHLPGYRYQGDDPDGFMVAADLNTWLAGYVASFDPPVREHTTVTSARPIEGASGGFDVRTADGTIIRAEQVVVATGGYHDPAVPRIAERLPARVKQLHSSLYKNAASLPEGPVLVVGTGQSGAQIAEDLLLARREVHLAVGSAPRFARRYRGRDVIAWMHDTGHYAKPVTDKPVEERHQDRTNHYVTGRDGGRDIDLRSFALAGMTLHGHLAEITPDAVVFADDLERSLTRAGKRSAIRGTAGS
jgi:putative flavoprotein involved in K+ transport